MKIDRNSPAFPTIENTEYRSVPGMTVREHFAALAMQGIRSDKDMTQWAHQNSPDVSWSREHSVAYISVMQADALIDELNK